jgi:8-amino-7-oxononanoate synthase
MDGDEAHLPWLVLLAEKYGAALIIDEAHATGIYGRQGRGLVDQYGLTERVFARVVTFGKALGTHGAILLGNDNLRDYLINFARSFIYSTAAPFQTHLSVKMAYRYLQKYDHQAVIREKITLFRQLTQHSALKFIDSSSAIQSLIVGGNEQTRYLSRLLRDHGFDVRPILPPTVPPGKERLRICLHTYNTDGEILRLIALLNEFLS